MSSSVEDFAESDEGHSQASNIKRRKITKQKSRRIEDDDDDVEMADAGAAAADDMERDPSPSRASSQQQGASSVHWCFTLNNPTATEMDNPPEYNYLVVGKEVGESGTPHIQGYIALKKKARLTAMRKWLKRAHFEVMRGTPQQASDYCKKDGSFTISGALPETQGAKGGKARKKQYEDAVRMARENKLPEIDSEMYLRFRTTLMNIRDEAQPRAGILTDDTCAIWVWGPPGVGKSMKVWEDYPGAYLKTCNKWWDHYDREDYVVIEDIDPDSCKYMAHNLKRWLDRYPFKVETKGGSKDIRPKKIILTSNYSIEACFNTVDAAAIRRRCQVIHMNGPLGTTAV